jgi:hypothetical protein
MAGGHRCRQGAGVDALGFLAIMAGAYLMWTAYHNEHPVKVANQVVKSYGPAAGTGTLNSPGTNLA